MVHRLSLLLLVAGLLSIAVGACDDDIVEPEPSGDSPVTPRENAEAELAAEWLSGKVLAPTALYNEVLADFAAIRTEHADSVEDVAIAFAPYWVPSTLLLSFQPATFAGIESGTYAAWAELNDRYRVVDMETFPDYQLVRLVFHGRLNPNPLVDEYAGLPGLVYVTPAVYPGDRPLVLIAADELPRIYMFRDASGGCNAACTVSEVSYFTVQSDGPRFDGIETYVGTTDTSGVRWELFRRSLEEFHTLNQWPPLTAPSAHEVSRLAAEATVSLVRPALSGASLPAAARNPAMSPGRSDRR